MRRPGITRALILGAALTLALIGGAAGHGAYLRPAPQPLIDIGPAERYAGKPIEFRALAENAHRPIVTGSWDFGDGRMSDDIWSTDHTYTTAGTYTVALTLIDQDGQKGTITKTVTVAPDLAPVPQIVVTPEPPEAGDSVFFTAIATTDEADDAYGLPLTYSWDVTGPESFTGSSGSMTRTLSSPGEYTVELTATDSNGSAAVTTATITVEPAGTYADGPPTAWPDVTPVTGAVAGRDTVAFDGSGSSDPGGPIATYAWQFGDGSVGTGTNPTHVYAAAGEYLVTLTVTDGDGRTATNFNVVNVEPGELAADVSAAPVTGAAVTFDASSSYVSGTGTSYIWVFGDGWWAAGPVVTHEYVLPGTYNVDLYVANAEGDVLAISETVVVAAGAPPALTSGGDPPAATAPATSSTAAPATAAPGAPVVGPPSTPLEAAPAPVAAAKPSGRTLVGTSAADALTGSPYADRLAGGGGNDVLVGGRGRDVLDGGRGNDLIDARDGEIDIVRCGAGRDRVRADRGDRVARDCETVRRG